MDNYPGVDLSKMSPAQRARLDALIIADGDEALRVHLQGAIGRADTARGAHGGSRAVMPERWTQIHVLDRLEEAYEVLAAMPAATRPKSYGSAWPTVQPERLSLYDQVMMGASGELEERNQDRNRVRLAPTTAQVTRMEQALRWPFEYLGDKPELAKAISLRAMWAVMRVDIRKRCQRRGIDHDRFNRDWQQALGIITAALISQRVPVS